ncbi:MAG: hypothetical protein K6A69_04195 [Lachnospiraceae bacterium]|nr:hypothetical protein [Lachnospiraceae bacterium]
MQEAVTIKSGKHGVSLLCSPDVDFETLVRETCVKFANSRDFFGKSSMVISFYGRDLSFEEQEVMIQAIELNSDVRINLVMEDDQVKERSMLGQVNRFYSDKINETAQIHVGDVEDGTSISSNMSLLVLGNVYEGATIKAAGNIIVFGALYGNAIAGASPNCDGAYIVAKELYCEEATISKVSGDINVSEDSFKLFKRRKKEPVLISIMDNMLVAEPVTNELLMDLVGNNVS